MAVQEAAEQSPSKSYGPDEGEDQVLPGPADSSNDDEADAAPWKALFFFTTRANLPILILAILCSVVAGAVSPAQAYLTGKLFDGFTNYSSGMWDISRFMQEQKKYVLYLVALAGGSWIFHALEFTLWLAFGELQAKSARDRLFHGLLEKDIEWYDMRKNGIGALLPRLQAQIRDLQLADSQPLGLLFNALAQAVLSLAEAFYYSWKLTLVTLATSPLIVVSMVILGSNMQKYVTRQQEKLNEAQKFSTSAFSAIETVKCFNGQTLERKKYMQRIHEAAGWYFREMHMSGLQMATGLFFTSSMFVQGFYYGGLLISSGKANAGTVVTTFFAAIGAFQALQIVLPQMVNLEKGKTAGATLRAVMAEVQRGPTVRRKSGRLAPRGCKGDIHAKNLTFAYPSRPDQLALDDVTLYIPAGEMTFLIGKSGSGKSTLSQLLMHFYSASKGTVTVDGVPLDSLEVSWLRSNVTLVEQQSLLFNDTVFRNIAFGRTDHSSVTRKEVMEAAEFALLQLMITDMPDGLDTMVGYKGGTMSGGQRQRMALARARLRDTPILILDESTSALDHISRTLMMDAIRQWRHGKTTIVITHDITQILPDDYLYLLEHGKLVQEGYRKHLEKMKDTPFQGFLPPEQRATLSPFDSRKGTAYESVLTRGTSLDSLSDDAPRAYLSYDPLDAQLTASENKRATFLPTAFKDAHQLPYMGALGKLGPANSARMWMAASSPSPPDSGRWSRMLDGAKTSPGPSPNAPNSARWSQMLEKLVEGTGRFAADARTATLGSVHTRRRPVATAVSSMSDEIQQTVKSEDGLTEYTQLSLRQILATVWPSFSWSERFVMVLGFYGASVHAAAIPAFAYVLSKLLGTYSVPGGEKHLELVYSMAILGVSFADAAHSWLFRFMLGCLGQVWADGVRDKAVERILDQPKAFFDLEENSVSHLTECLDRNAEMMRELLSNFACLGYVAALMSAIAILWSLASQWKMTLIALAISPYILGVSRIYAAVSGRWEVRSNDAAEAASSIFTETFNNIRTVRALTLESHFRDKYITATNHAVVVGFQRSLNTGFFFGLSDCAGNFALALLFYVAAYLVKKGATVHSVILVAVMLMFAITNVSTILGIIPQVGSSQDAASRLMRLSSLPKDSHEHMGDTGIVAVGEILLNDLRFAYPSRPDQIVLRDIKLSILPGTSTAIVGGSGSGKSTIASLLLDIWSTAQLPVPNAHSGGELMIGGRDIRTISTDTLRSLIVPVSQSPTLFAATVAENITYGLPVGSPYSQTSAVMEAAEQAGIHDFITSLPLGYDTLIGDGGMGLSGGQAQRIAIARALVRKPSVLILDEATSALDVESAGLVRQTIKKLVHKRSRNLTVIIITHSRDMMEIAENIVVLDQGQIVETGGFEELLAKEGALSNLLSGGEWHNDREQSRSRSRKRGVPRMKEVDWRARRNRGRKSRI